MKSKTKKRLHNLFKEHISDLKIKSFLKRWFGPKCKDYDENCHCCKRWRSYEELTKNPFDKSE